MVTIHDERPADIKAREALLDRAFGPSRFAKTCERLREGRLPAEGLSLAAHDGQRLVGTIRFWHIAAGPGRPALLLGPVTVDEASRGSGLGAALVREGLSRARVLGHEAALLVGDAPYYGRFGFRAAATAGLDLPGPFERERFLGLDLAPGALEGARGLVSAAGALDEQPDLAALVAVAANDLAPAGQRAA